MRCTFSDQKTNNYLEENLPEQLVARLQVKQGHVSMKLGTCTDVFTTFDEMVALYALARDGPFHYGPGHEYNATPDETLRTWSCLYLGPWEERAARKPSVLISQAFSEELEHRGIWRRTKKVQSKHGTWYYRKLRPDETSGARGNPNGRKVACPNEGKAFRAAKVGFAWNYEHNLGRDLYRCKPCDLLFNTGEYETPQYADLAASLRAHQAELDEQIDNLDGGALVYHVTRNRATGIGIDHVVNGMIAKAEKGDALDAVRYLLTASEDYLEPMTLQHERTVHRGTDAPLTMDELESFAQLYYGAFQLKYARKR